MDETNIQGLILTPLKIIENPKGDIYHGVKKNDTGFLNFGEAYFSAVNPGAVKGWNKHTKMTLNLIVPEGAVAFVIYDDRDNSKTKNRFYKIVLSLENYYRLTVPPGLWLAFKGKGKGKNLILNVSDFEHDPDELEKANLDSIEFSWDLI